MKKIQLFIQMSRPIYVLSAALLYILGAGIAHYLSGPLNWQSFFLGLVWVIFILLGFQYLNEYFDFSPLSDDPSPKHTPFSGSSGAIGPGRLSRQVALWAGLTCLTVTASMTVLIFKNLGFNQMGIVIMGLIFLGGLIYALPPFRLVASGYGELILSIIIVGLIPAWSFQLQGHALHRLLIMVAFPLTTLHISMLLALEFPDYASDLKQGRKPIVVRTGWQRAMLLHNLLILASFVLLGAAFAFGLPLRLGWPVFLVLPIGLFQIWMMNRIGEGAKPNWNLLVLVALSTFNLSAYILTFAFWTH